MLFFVNLLLLFFFALMFLTSFKTSEIGCCSQVMLQRYELIVYENLALCGLNRISHSWVSDRNAERSFLSLMCADKHTKSSWNREDGPKCIRPQAGNAIDEV